MLRVRTKVTKGTEEAGDAGATCKAYVGLGGISTSLSG